MQHDVWVIEPMALAREAIRLLLREPFHVTCQVPDVSTLDKAAAKEVPSIILYSLHSSNDDKGEIEAIESLSRSHPGVVVVLADALELPQLKSAMQAGASGYLLQDVSPDALHCAMSLTMAGEKVLPTGLVDMLLEGNKVFGRAAAKENLPTFSPAEIRILKHLARGASNKQIALDCAITEGTVKVHLKSIFRRIGAANRTQAALWSLENIDPEPSALHELSAGQKPDSGLLRFPAGLS